MFYFEEFMNESKDSEYIKLQRCQMDTVIDKYDFNSGSGQNGNGVYAFRYGDAPMKRYYSSRGEHTYTFKIKKEYVYDLSTSKLDYWKIQEFIYNNPKYKCFIFKHKGLGIPSSKEYLITDPEIIEMM